jgi:hypothetical protein
MRLNIQLKQLLDVLGSLSLSKCLHIELPREVFESFELFCLTLGLECYELRLHFGFHAVY